MKKFISFEEMGYKTGLVDFYNNSDIEGQDTSKHFDNNFIGIYGDKEKFDTAYCDSVTGKIYLEPIFFDDGILINESNIEFDGNLFED